jgi:hypothetical protein
VDVTLGINKNLFEINNICICARALVQYPERFNRSWQEGKQIDYKKQRKKRKE